MTSNLEDDIRAVFARMDTQESQDNTQPPQEERQTFQEEIQDVYVLIVREQEDEHVQVVESTPIQPQKSSMLPAYAICCLYLLLIVSTLAFQLYCMMNPPGVTISIIPRSQTVTLTGTMQLGRVLPSLTISQSQTTQATGKGHQDAKVATGSVTFYNGQFQRVTIAAGTILTGVDGTEIITDRDVTIPAANPPSFGQVTISAHAINPGAKGNIPAYDINQACCAASILAKNTGAFTGGQDERTFQTVTKSDIFSTAAPLKAAVTHSMQGALQGQLKPNEQLQLLPCTPTVTSDHPIGAEATQVIATVSETCSAIAYNSQELQTKATALLATQATQKIGTGYSLIGNVHVTVKQASVTSTPHPLVFLSFHMSGTWIYGLSQPAQQRIIHLLAGKTTQAALHLVAALPGVERATIHFTGFGDETRLPKQSSLIHLAFIVT